MSAAVAAGLQAAGGLVGGLLDARNNRKIAKMNIKMQKEFAQHGVRWRTEDAKKAGLHPLAALGMQATGFNPVSSGTNFQEIGQDIGRAVGAGLTHEERGGLQGEMAKLSVEKAKLENDFLRAQIVKLNAPGTPPARPTVDAGSTTALLGQGDARRVEIKPAERVAAAPANPSQEAGESPAVQFIRGPAGGYFPVKSKAAAEGLEDDWIGNVDWSIQNRLIPRFTGLNQNPPPRSQKMIDEDSYWSYHPFYGEYLPVKRRFPGIYW